MDGSSACVVRAAEAIAVAAEAAAAAFRRETAVRKSCGGVGRERDADADMISLRADFES